MKKVQNRFRLFVGNFFAFGLIGVLNKAIPILILPIITRLINDTAEFGQFDMYSTLVSFGSQIAAFGLYDAAFREYFEKDDPLYQKKVLSVTLRLELFFAFIVSILLIVFQEPILQMFLGNTQNTSLAYFAGIAVFISGANMVFAMPMKVKNQKTVYAISGILSATVSYGFALILLLRGFSYMAMVWGSLLSLFSLLLFYVIRDHRDFSLKIFDWKLAKDLFLFGLPLMPVFLIYWVFHSMDKIMITQMMGLADVGVYAIGAKVAMVSQLIYTAFAGGWQYFAFSTMKDKDQVHLTSQVFEYLAAISYGTTLLACVCDRFVFQLVFPSNYAAGSAVFPFLFLSPLLLMLFQTAANQMLVVKKSYRLLQTLLIGVTVNLVLNYFGILGWGIKGAAFATVCGYGVAVIGISIAVIKQKLMTISLRFIGLSALVFLVMVLHLLFADNIILDVVSLVGMIVVVWSYRKDIGDLKTMLTKTSNPTKEDLQE